MSEERLFLHFLDREVSILSRSFQRLTKDFVEVFNVCALHSYEQMVLSGGHLFEHPAAQSIFRRHFDLFHDGQITPIAQERSIEDFVQSKSVQYEHTRDSTQRDYSVYFGGQWEEVFNGPINFEAPTADTTTALASEVLKDFSYDEDEAKRVIEAIQERNKKAITSELFVEIQEQLSSCLIRDLHFSISKNYQSIYRIRYAPKIFIGTNLVNKNLESDAGNELSYPLSKYLYNNLNLQRIFREPSFSFSQLRGSIEHTRYVLATRALFDSMLPNDVYKLGKILSRTVPDRFLGRRVVAEIDTQFRAISGALEQFSGLRFDQIYDEVTREYCEVRINKLDSELKVMEMNQKDTTNYSNPQIFLVIAAQKELNYAREFLRANDFDLSSEIEMADNKIGHIFHLKREVAGTQVEVPVALIRANQKGKSEMRALVEAIDHYEDPLVVIMVGMMAGINGKSKIFDVIAPRTIYDATTVSTGESHLTVEPVPTYMDTSLHNRVGNMEWGVTPESHIPIITDKVTVTVPGTFESITHELAVQAITRDPDNTVGLEMEASALSEKQRDQTQVKKSAHYLMIKGVADYAGAKIPGEEVEELRGIEAVSAILPDKRVKDFDPRGNSEVKAAFQREATNRSIQVALRVLSVFPRL